MFSANGGWTAFGRVAHAFDLADINDAACAPSFAQFAKGGNTSVGTGGK
jgi:hypothetical protein